MTPLSSPTSPLSDWLDRSLALIGWLGAGLVFLPFELGLSLALVATPLTSGPLPGGQLPPPNLK